MKSQTDDKPPTHPMMTLTFFPKGKYNCQMSMSLTSCEHLPSPSHSEYERDEIVAVDASLLNQRLFIAIEVQPAAVRSLGLD